MQHPLTGKMIHKHWDEQPSSSKMDQPVTQPTNEELVQLQILDLQTQVTNLTSLCQGLTRRVNALAVVGTPLSSPFVPYIGAQKPMPQAASPYGDILTTKWEEAIINFREQESKRIAAERITAVARAKQEIDTKPPIEPERIRKMNAQVDFKPFGKKP